jgi:hypothetical protein
MKNFLLINFFILVSLTARPQVSITVDDLPVAGKGYLLGVTTSGTSSLSPGNGGNTSWNFSSLTETTQETGGTLLLSQTPYPTAFPNATHATYNADTDGETYTYYTLSSSKAEVTGVVFISSTLGSSVVLTTVQPLNYYTLPISMGNKSSSKGVYKGKVAYQLAAAHVDSIEVTLALWKSDTVDAYGSTVTPTGSYDAIRLKTVAKRRISARARSYGVWAPADALYPPGFAKETSFNWWAKGIGSEVFRMVYEDSTLSYPTKATWFESVVSGLEDESFEEVGTRLSPNPASSTITISTNLASMYDLRISTLQGHQVLSKQSVMGTQTIPVDSFAPGIYVATLTASNGRSFKSKFVVQK